MRNFTAMESKPATQETEFGGDPKVDLVDNTMAAHYIVDPDEEKRVLKKIDRIIMPLMALVYFFQYLDKQCINYASVFGLEESLGLSGLEYSWAVSLFYIGQLVSEYPAAYLMSRFSVVQFVGICIILWGTVAGCLGASQNFASIGAIRFLLGFTEGAVAPSFMIITGTWYKRTENPIRVAVWVSMFGVSQVVGGLMMYGIGMAEMSFDSWRVMFILCGGLTVLAGVLFIIFMPREPSVAWFLKENERRVAVERLALDRGTRDRSNFDMKQFREAFTDPRTWLYGSMALFICLPTPIVKFSSKVIHGFGYDSLTTMLVGLPGGAIAFTLIWIGALGPLRFPNSRCFFGVFLAIMPMFGSLLLLFLPQDRPWGVVAGTWFAGSTAPPVGQAIALMGANVKGNTKRSVVGAIFFIFYCIGCIVGPQLWQAKDAPRYTKGCITSIVSWICLSIAFLTFYFTGKGNNQKRDREVAVFGQVHDDTIGVSDDDDRTEKEDPLFRFSL
ncbi:transporter [Paramyrothecium foliicola]|nr:transporter [Paramyrothecium foliicola]